MATTPRPKTAAEGEKDSAAIEEQLARIKADISELASTLASLSSKRVRGARDQADQRLHDMAGAGEDAVEEVRRQLRMIERDVEARVRDKPLQTLGIAAGVGFLLALIVRR